MIVLQQQNIKLDNKDIPLSGSQIITKLAILLLSVADGVANIFNPSSDKEINELIEILQQLGAHIVVTDNFITIKGCGLRGLQQPENVLNVSDSLETLSFVLALVSNCNFTSFITGSNRITNVDLTEMINLVNPNVHIKLRNDKYLPLAIEGFKNLKQARQNSKNTTNKYTALLMSLYNSQDTVIMDSVIKEEYLEKMMQFLGIDIKENLFENRNFLTRDITTGKEIYIAKTNGLTAKDITVPLAVKDIIYPLLLTLIIPDSELTLKNVSLDELNNTFIKILADNGANIALSNQRINNNIKVVDINVKCSTLSPLTISAKRLGDIGEDYASLLLINVLNKNPIKIQGIQQLDDVDNLDCILGFLKYLNVEYTQNKHELSIDEYPKTFGSTKQFSLQNTGKVSKRVLLSIFLSGIVLKDGVAFEGELEDFEDEYQDFMTLIETLNISTTRMM